MTATSPAAPAKVYFTNLRTHARESQLDKLKHRDKSSPEQSAACHLSASSALSPHAAPLSRAVILVSASSAISGVMSFRHL